MRRASVFLAAFMATALAGCGGGGGGSAGGGDGLVSQTINGNGVSATYMAKAGVKPQVFGSNTSGAAFTGLYGVAFTSVTPNQAASLANTKIVFDRNGVLWVTDPSFSTETSLSADLPVGGAGYSASPAIHPNGRVAAATLYDPLTTQIQLYFVALDGTSSTRMTSGPQPSSSPAWSPSGNTCVYSYGPYGSGQIYSIPSGGGTPTNLSNNGFDDLWPEYSRDGTKIYFWRLNVAAGQHTSYVMNANGSNQVPSPMGSSSGLAGAAFSPDGHLYVVSDGAILYFYSPTSGLITTVNPPSGHGYKYPTFSPDGRTILVNSYIGSTSNLAEVRFDGDNPHDITASSTSTSSYGAASWGPYPSNRQVIGSSGSLATAASGFIMGQMASTITSFVAFNTVTASTAAIVPQAATNYNTVFQLKGDSINRLAYLNDLSFAGTVIVPVSGVSSIGGALVSFDVNTGKVVSVVPYSPGAPKMATGKTGILEYTGRFVGVWDSSGKNLAPHGAGFVSFDPRTGKLIGFS